MNREEIFTAIIVIVLAAVIIGGLIYGLHSADVKQAERCINDAKIIHTEGRLNEGSCQLKTSTGVWLYEQDYLMLCASEKCP